MGKNIKGKECGTGIFQRKDGWYIARFVDKRGTRHEKYFKTIPMDRYVHVTNDSMLKAVSLFEESSPTATV